VARERGGGREAVLELGRYPVLLSQPGQVDAGHTRLGATSKPPPSSVGLNQAQRDWPRAGASRSQAGQGFLLQLGGTRVKSIAPSR